MAIAYDIPRTIGICGAAQSGKDTLCNALTQAIQGGSPELRARRFSIAGDQIRTDLEKLVWETMSWDIHQLDPHQKEVIRPIMVEYGRMMRNTTKGRYFIQKLACQTKFHQTPIRIIPDIRYDEFQYDERYWLKEEANGFLIYINRKGVNPANKFETENLQRLYLAADHIVNWDTLDNLESDALIVAKQILNQHFSVTTSPEGNVPLSVLP